MLQFCPNCKTLLRPDRNKGKLVCINCGYEKEITSKNRIILSQQTYSKRRSKEIIVDDGNYGAKMPTTNVPCPKCGFEEAYWWFVQTRRADEPPTTFYRCKKCGHTWRDYR